MSKSTSQKRIARIRHPTWFLYFDRPMRWRISRLKNYKIMSSERAGFNNEQIILVTPLSSLIIPRLSTSAGLHCTAVFVLVLCRSRCENGACNSGGTCVCNTGWTGQYCTKQVTPGKYHRNNTYIFS